MAALVFDLGGTHLRAAIGAADGTIARVEKHRIDSVANRTPTAAIWRGIQQKMAAYVRAAEPRLGARDPIVVSFPGPIDPDGRILSAPTLVGDCDAFPDLKAQMQAAFGRPVHLLNDLSAAAWSIGRTVPGRFLVVTVSSGIGNKVFDPRIGAFDDIPFGGEIGHSVVDTAADAVACDCGGRGHLGAIASGRGIERAARREAHDAPAAFLKSQCATRYGATPQSLTNEDHLIPALRDGDPWTEAIVRRCSRPLAAVLAHIMLAVGVDRVIVIGGFAQAAGEPYLRLLHQALHAQCDYRLLRDTIAQRVSLGALDEETCLQGAAVYAAARARP